MSNSKAKKIVSGLGWTFGERILAQSVSFFVSIVLARLLIPEDYGLVSLVLVFINLANVFVTSGFGESLIQKKDADQTDFSTMFWCTFFFSCLLYLVLFFTAPLIGEFYSNRDVILVVRVLSLMIPLSSIKTIQYAYVSKNMIFKKFFFSTLGGTLLSGIVGIYIAYKGGGVWALVAQYLINSTIDTIILFITVDWYPQLLFNRKKAKKLLKYAIPMTAASLINELYTQIRALIIGKMYSSADLAYYNRGNQFPSLFITNINVAITKVFFPIMSDIQNDLAQLKNLSRKTLKISSYLIFPILIGLMAISRTLVLVLLTEKWLPCVKYIQILSIFWMTQPLQAVNWQILKALGKSDLCFKLEVIKKMIGFILILMTMFISVEALAWSTTIFAIISMLINMIPNKKLIDYSFLEQSKDISSNFILALFMGMCVYFIGMITIVPEVLILILQIVLGVFIYWSSSIIFKFQEYEYLKLFILENIKK